MSGGSMNYLYSKLEYDATFRTDTSERKAFAKHLQLVAKAWAEQWGGLVLSGEMKSIRTGEQSCLHFNPRR